MSTKDDIIEVEGDVIEVLPGGFYRVQISGKEGFPETKIVCHLSGKMRKNFIRIIPGDRVKVELTVYDLTKGRIVFRQTNTRIANPS